MLGDHFENHGLCRYAAPMIDNLVVHIAAQIATWPWTDSRILTPIDRNRDHRGTKLVIRRMTMDDPAGPSAVVAGRKMVAACRYESSPNSHRIIGTPTRHPSPRPNATVPRQEEKHGREMVFLSCSFGSRAGRRADLHVLSPKPNPESSRAQNRQLPIDASEQTFFAILRGTNNISNGGKYQVSKLRSYAEVKALIRVLSITAVLYLSIDPDEHL
ncbi:uncharacterized protein MYCFIDRAFT_178511 [Pseudocercospora fijiensis CIRAD86]|uniref:Uncharacterized protein n=1 Tax=Pseudocercospora fijiensis (strain CIRAD86) TaxID=383855 RepID=M3AML6_PSEFD|nr:uncharacterized protein MYCFIDRAFT_178511 [Pseudocercospora fijiensis CIRAD86]EME78363.1 hypothetical protein MYCFIDRAFT_178511 [Pseudocercospora fijiensis CIRAD86]